MISGVSKAVLEVEDQDRAKAFWTETMGFEVVQDAPYGQERWLEVRSPDGAVNLVLELRGEGGGGDEEVPEHLPTSNVMFRCDDLPATYEGLTARGVEFPQPPVRQPFGWWSMFRDSEGNRFALEQEALMSTSAPPDPTPLPPAGRVVRLHAPGGPADLAVEEIEIPRPGPGEVLVRVHAAAITRDELEWSVDRLPAIPSYELSGVVAATGEGVEAPKVGDAVFALTPFDRDGVAAEYAVVPANCVAPKPGSVGHVEAAAVPMGGLSAWQGLFVHGALEAGQRVLVHGGAGGVGHLACQLARWRGAHVIATATGAGVEAARGFGAHEVIDRSTTRFEEALQPVDLVFDTVGGDALARSGAVLREGGRIVSVAEEAPEGVEATYFVVEPEREQLVELARLIDEGALRPAIDAVYPLADAEKAFERVMASGKRGKVVLEVRG